MDQSTNDVTAAIVAMLAMRDPYTNRHQQRTAELAITLAAQLSSDAAFVETVASAATLHDIGKNGTPAEILTTARELTDPEYAVMQAHVQSGYDLISSVASLVPAAEMVLQHHERLDGSGYPNGISGHDIGFGGRILAVADTIEAMCSYRPYRPPPGIEEALTEITTHRRTRYDADVVDACVDLFNHGAFRFETQPI